MAHIEIGENGQPEHVFVEKDCDDPEINAVVMRTMHKGKLLKPGARCSGQVTVNFGSR